MRLPRHAWWLYLALIAPVTAVYLAGPLNYAPVYNAIGFSACIAMVVGVRAHRPAARWAWYVLAIGQALAVTGDVLAYNYTVLFGGALPDTSIADVFYLASYPVIVAGLLLLLRRRNPGHDWASLLDSAIVTIGLALLSWIVLISPLAHNTTLPLGTKLVAMAYPLGDILMLGVAARMAVGTGRRSPAYYLMISSIVVVLAADSVYAWSLLHGVYSFGTVLNGAWIAAHLLFGAAALHPSMTTVSQAAAPEQRLTLARLLGIAAATLIAPAVVVFEASPSDSSDVVLAGCAAIVLLSLVILRMLGLARDQQAATERERTLRRAADALVTATSRTEIIRAAQDAAAMLAGADAQPTVLEIEHRGANRPFAALGPRVADGEPRLRLAALPEGVLDQLGRRVAVDLPSAEALLGAGSGDTPAFAVPILAQGALAGAVALLDARGTSAPTRYSLETLAAQVGLALESAALTESGLRAEGEARLSALIEHSTDVILVLASDSAVEYVSPSVRQILGHDACDFVGERLLDHVADQDRALVQAALRGRSPRAGGTSEAFQFRVRHHDGRLLDTECLVTNLLENAAVGGIVVNLRDITERKQFEEQLTYQAFHDPVTDLANRALFRDRVEHAISRRSQSSPPLAVLFLDLDDFKSVNDTLGHVAGDRVLQIISSRVRSALRAGDTVARLGGDEFAVLLEDVVDETAVSEIVEGLLELISAPLSMDGREVSVECSIGIAVARPAGDTAAEIMVDEVLRNADVAMYQAKAADGDTYRHFKPEMHAAVVRQLALRAELKAAIAAEQLTLAYQPIYDLATGEVAGYEALLRWEHATLGAISPVTFIPVAEDSGLIIPLGRWVLQRACEDAVAFQRTDPHPAQHTLSVNISARQLQRPEIVGEVREALRSSGLSPSSLVLEITESLLLDDINLAIERLGALRELGVRIAVDDFGKGYSSLSYIGRLPIDFIKIDKQFIDSVDADDKEGRLTAAIIGLSRVLGLGCVAEGVERSAQHERLKQLGCDFAQGFLLARPMSAEALSALLSASVPALATVA